MKWLKKIGGAILKGKDAIAVFAPQFALAAPILKALLPDKGDQIVDKVSGAVVSVEDRLTVLAGIVVQGEAIGQTLQLDGPTKARMIAPLVGQILMSSSLLAGREIKDPQAFLLGCERIGGGIADVLNAIDDK